MSEKLIDQIKQPSDLKKLDKKELKVLADELREIIVNTVSKNGGHLSSNLGVVELTLALHQCFSSGRADALHIIQKAMDLTLRAQTAVVFNGKSVCLIL